MKFRFEPNDTVMYGGQGACTLVEVAEKDFGGEAKCYYVLRSVFSGGSVFYVPVDSETLTAKMRLLKSAEDILKIIKGNVPSEWIEEDRARQNYLKQVVDCGGTETLVATMKQLLAKQKEFSEIGKKLRAADERSLYEIERLLMEELSFVFEVSKDDVEPFVLGEKMLNKK